MRSLRAKVTLLVVLLGVPFLIGSVQGLLFASESSNLQERKSLAKRALNRLARDLQGTDPRSRVETLYDQSGLDELGVGATLVDKNGTALWESPHRAPAKERRGVQQHILDEGNLLYVMPERQESDGPRQLAYVITGVGLLAYAVGAWMLVGVTLRPISKLVDRVNDTKRDPSLEVASPSSDREMVSLVATLNSLIQEIRADSEERVNSYATLSHELRTPIHSLLLNLDLALGQEQSREEMETTLIEAQKQVYRLNRLSEAVLTLQGLTRSADEVAQEPVRLTPVLEEVLDELQPLIEVRELTIHLDAAPDLTAITQPQHIELLLRNLLENAVKHSPPKSEVFVEERYAEEGMVLEIRNASHGGRQMAGNGLGLRICQEIVRRSGWKLECGESAGTYLAKVWLAKR